MHHNANFSIPKVIYTQMLSKYRPNEWTSNAARFGTHQDLIYTSQKSLTKRWCNVLPISTCSHKQEDILTRAYVSYNYFITVLHFRCLRMHLNSRKGLCNAHLKVTEWVITKKIIWEGGRSAATYGTDSWFNIRLITKKYLKFPQPSKDSDRLRSQNWCWWAASSPLLQVL